MKATDCSSSTNRHLNAYLSLNQAYPDIEYAPTKLACTILNICPSYLRRDVAVLANLGLINRRPNARGYTRKDLETLREFRYLVQTLGRIARSSKFCVASRWLTRESSIQITLSEPTGLNSTSASSRTVNRMNRPPNR